jgi:hypothetical protein
VVVDTLRQRMGRGNHDARLIETEPRSGRCRG